MKSINKRLITAFLALLLITVMSTSLISGVFAGYWVSDVVSVTAVYVRPNFIDLSIGGNNLSNIVVPGQAITLAVAPQVVLAPGSSPCYVFIDITKTGNFDTYLYFEFDGWTKLEYAGANANVYYKKIDTDVGSGGLTLNIIKNNTVYADETVTRTVIAQIDTTPVSFTINAYAVEQSAEIVNAATAWAALQQG